MAYIEDTNLIEEIKSLKISVGGKDVFPDEAKKSVLRVIGEQPIADVVEVKHAHWREGRFLKVGDSVKGYPSVICSDCGITFCDIINNHNYMYRYCPNCGAKMDGGKTE